MFVPMCVAVNADGKALRALLDLPFTHHTAETASATPLKADKGSLTRSQLNKELAQVQVVRDINCRDHAAWLDLTLATP